MGVTMMAVEDKGFFEIDEEQLQKLGIHVTRDADGRVIEIREGRLKWDDNKNRFVKANGITRRLYMWKGNLQAQGSA
jgi:hypothetical protein